MRGALKGASLMCGVFLLICAPVFAETIVFNTQLWSLDLTGNAVMPLASGWGNIATSIKLTQSSNFSSLGQTTAIGSNQSGQFQVESFFDVFFDLTIRDTDVNVNFPGMADGSSLTFMNNGPTHLESTYSAIYDQDSINYGLFPPPEANPYRGFFNFQIPLEADLNNNIENDVIKFISGELTLLDNNRTFIILPDGMALFSLDATLVIDGGVMDLSSDPPFSITLVGPTTASSHLDGNPVVPEPATLVLLGSGLLGLIGLRRKVTKQTENSL